MTDIELQRAALQLAEKLLTLTEEEQASKLAEVKEQDERLHAEVMALLNSAKGASAEGFLSFLADESERDTPMGSLDGTAVANQDIPSSIDRFQIRRVIGMGGMGVVYEAHDPKSQRNVAIKLIRSDFLSEISEDRHESVIERFRNEAQATAKLEHDCIVRVYEVGEHAKRPYYVMQLVQGESLSALLHESERPSAERIAKYMLHVAEALHEAHEHGIIHRDIKPANLILDRKLDRVMIADFGLVKILGESSDHTKTADMLGSPNYMSREQYQDASRVDARSDIYSLGATLYHLLTGEPPFRRDTKLETLRAIEHDAPVPPKKTKPSIPRDLESICMKCLEKPVEWRYQTGLALAEDLQRFLDKRPVHARRVTTLYRFGRWCRRKPLQIAMIVACVALMAGAFVAVNLNAELREADVRGQMNDLFKSPISEALVKADEFDTTSPVVLTILSKAWKNRELNNPDAIRLAIPLLSHPTFHDESMSHLVDGLKYGTSVTSSECFGVLKQRLPDNNKQKLWSFVADSNNPNQARVRVASLLANTATAKDGRWASMAEMISSQLVNSQTDSTKELTSRFVSIKDELIPKIDAFTLDSKHPSLQRHAFEALVILREGNVDHQLEQLLSAPPEFFDVSYAPLRSKKDQIVKKLKNVVAREDGPGFPSVTDAVAEQLKKADGIATASFAFCQSLLLSDFEALCENLGRSGYRPIRCRPYHDKRDKESHIVLTAAIWVRDGKAFQIGLGQSQEAIEKFDQQRRNDGFGPEDIAGYVANGQPDCPLSFVGIWVADHNKAQKRTLILGIPKREFQSRFDKMIEDRNYSGATIQQTADNKHQEWRSQILEPRAVNYKGQRGSRFDLNVLSAGNSKPNYLVDLTSSFVNAATHNIPNYAGIWHASPGKSSYLWRSESFTPFLAEATAYSDRGYRPVALSVTIIEGKPHVLRVWRSEPVQMPDRIRIAKRRAIAAIALALLNDRTGIEKITATETGSNARTYLIQWLGNSETARQLLVDLLSSPSPGVNQIAALSLGDILPSTIEEGLRAKGLNALKTAFQNSPSGAVHSATSWALNRWNEHQDLSPEEFGYEPSREWWVNSIGQSMSIVKLQKLIDPGMKDGFAIAVSATETTTSEFLKFESEVGRRRFSPQAEFPNRPADKVTWMMAAEFCNWLSAKDGIPKEEWCYTPNSAGKYGNGMRIKPNYRSLAGYRLPTDADRRIFAQRVLANRPRWNFGDDRQFLEEYAWIESNSNEHAHDVAQLKPNDFGLFDVIGNISELMHPRILRRHTNANGLPEQLAFVVWNETHMANTADGFRQATLSDDNSSEIHANIGTEHIGFRVVCNVPSTTTKPTIAKTFRRRTLPDTEKRSVSNVPQELVGVLGHSKLKHWRSVRAVAFSPDGNQLFSSSDDHTVMSWDLKTHQRKFVADITVETINDIEVSKNGSIIVAVGWDGLPKILDAETGKVLKTLLVPDSVIPTPIKHCVLSTDQKTCYALTSKGRIYSWDIATGNNGPQFESLSKLVDSEGRGICVLANNQIVSAHKDGGLRVWDHLGTFQRNVTVAKGVGIKRMALTPDSDRFVVGGDDGVVRVGRLDGAFEVLTKNTGTITAVKCSSDGKHCAIARVFGYIEIVDIAEKRILHSIRSNGGTTCHDVTFSSDGQLLAVACDDAAIRLFNVENGQPVLDWQEHSSACSALDISHDNRYLISGSYDGTAMIWDMDRLQRTRLELRSLPADRNLINAIDCSPADQTAVVVGTDAMARVIDLATGKQKGDGIRMGNSIRDVSYSPDGTKIALINQLGKIEILSMPRGRTPIKLRTFNDGSGWSLAFSPDGRYLATGTGRYQPSQITLRETENGWRSSKILGNNSKFYDMVFSTDGSRLFSIELDKFAVRDSRVDRQNPDVLHLLPEEKRFSQPNCLALSPNGEWLAIGTYDGVIHFQAKGRPIKTIRIGPSGGCIDDMVFDSTGDFLLTANRNSTVTIFNVAELSE